jgi:hypothetical protein
MKKNSGGSRALQSKWSDHSSRIYWGLIFGVIASFVLPLMSCISDSGNDTSSQLVGEWKDISTTQDSVSRVESYTCYKSDGKYYGMVFDYLSKYDYERVNGIDYEEGRWSGNSGTLTLTERRRGVVFTDSNGIGANWKDSLIIDTAFAMADYSLKFDVKEDSLFYIPHKDRLFWSLRDHFPEPFAQICRE